MNTKLSVLFFVKRTKTNPNRLLLISSTILEKYEDHPQVVNQEKLLPILSNQQRAYLSYCPVYICHHCHAFKRCPSRKRFKNAWT